MHLRGIANHAQLRTDKLAIHTPARLRARTERRVDTCPVCKARKAEAPDIEARLLELLARSEPERRRTVRAVVRDELAAVAEHVDVAQVEEQLLDHL
jgi:hypothetical protein